MPFTGEAVPSLFQVLYLEGRSNQQFLAIVVVLQLTELVHLKYIEVFQVPKVLINFKNQNCCRGVYGRKTWVV